MGWLFWVSTGVYCGNWTLLIWSFVTIALQIVVCFMVDLNSGFGFVV